MQVDLRPFMQRNPFVVHSDANLSRTYRLFRTMGLRHLFVGPPCPKVRPRMPAVVCPLSNIAVQPYGPQMQRSGSPRQALPWPDALLLLLKYTLRLSQQITTAKSSQQAAVVNCRSLA